MKTPIQEFYEYMEQNQYFIGNDLYKKYYEMLEKEKEVIMNAYEAGSHTEWTEDTWMLVEKREYYNETFNTKKNV